MSKEEVKKLLVVALKKRESRALIPVIAELMLS
jgi:hypothetical protein